MEMAEQVAVARLEFKPSASAAYMAETLKQQFIEARRNTESALQMQWRDSQAELATTVAVCDVAVAGHRAALERHKQQSEAELDVATAEHATALTVQTTKNQAELAQELTSLVELQATLTGHKQQSAAQLAAAAVAHTAAVERAEAAHSSQREENRAELMALADTLVEHSEALAAAKMVAVEAEAKRQLVIGRNQLYKRELADAEAVATAKATTLESAERRALEARAALDRTKQQNDTERKAARVAARALKDAMKRAEAEHTACQENQAQLMAAAEAHDVAVAEHQRVAAASDVLMQTIQSRAQRQNMDHGQQIRALQAEHSHALDVVQLLQDQHAHLEVRVDELQALATNYKTAGERAEAAYTAQHKKSQAELTAFAEAHDAAVAGHQCVAAAGFAVQAEHRQALEMVGHLQENNDAIVKHQHEHIERASAAQTLCELLSQNNLNLQEYLKVECQMLSTTVVAAQAAQNCCITLVTSKVAAQQQLQACAVERQNTASIRQAVVTEARAAIHLMNHLEQQLELERQVVESFVHNFAAAKIQQQYRRQRTRTIMHANQVQMQAAMAGSTATTAAAHQAAVAAALRDSSENMANLLEQKTEANARAQARLEEELSTLASRHYAAATVQRGWHQRSARRDLRAAVGAHSQALGATKAVLSSEHRLAVVAALRDSSMHTSQMLDYFQQQLEHSERTSAARTEEKLSEREGLAADHAAALGEMEASSAFRLDAELSAVRAEAAGEISEAEARVAESLALEHEAAFARGVSSVEEALRAEHAAAVAALEETRAAADVARKEKRQAKMAEVAAAHAGETEVLVAGHATALAEMVASSASRLDAELSALRAESAGEISETEARIAESLASEHEAALARSMSSVEAALRAEHAAAVAAVEETQAAVDAAREEKREVEMTEAIAAVKSLQDVEVARLQSTHILLVKNLQAQHAAGAVASITAACSAVALSTAATHHAHTAKVEHLATNRDAHAAEHARDSWGRVRAMVASGGASRSHIAVLVEAMVASKAEVGEELHELETELQQLAVKIRNERHPKSLEQIQAEVEAGTVDSVAADSPPPRSLADIMADVDASVRSSDEGPAATKKRPVSGLLMEVDMGSEDAENSPTAMAARLLGVSLTVRKNKGTAGSGSPPSIPKKGSSSPAVPKKTGIPPVIPRKVGSPRSTPGIPKKSAVGISRAPAIPIRTGSPPVVPNKAGSSRAELTQQAAGFVEARAATQELQLGDTQMTLADKTEELRLANDPAGRLGGEKDALEQALQDRIATEVMAAQISAAQAAEAAEVQRAMQKLQTELGAQRAAEAMQVGVQAVVAERVEAAEELQELQELRQELAANMRAESEPKSLVEIQAEVEAGTADAVAGGAPGNMYMYDAMPPILHDGTTTPTAGEDSPPPPPAMADIMAKVDVSVDNGGLASTLMSSSGISDTYVASFDTSVGDSIFGVQATSSLAAAVGASPLPAGMLTRPQNPTAKMLPPGSSSAFGQRFGGRSKFDDSGLLDKPLREGLVAGGGPGNMYMSDAMPPILHDGELDMDTSMHDDSTMYDEESFEQPPLNLSSPWVEYKDDVGDAYYFNTKTEETVWETPEEGVSVFYD
jgi:hypothetical protein